MVLGISGATSMTIPDIVTTLREQNMLTADDKPHSPLPRSPAGAKGKNGNKSIRPRARSQLFGHTRRNSSRKLNSAKEDGNSEPSIPPAGSYTIHWDRAEVDAYLARWHGKGYLALKPHRLKWSPYLLARGALMLKTDTAPPQPLAASELPDASIMSSSARGQSLSMMSVDGGVSAVDQVASTGHAEAGPSRLGGASPSSSTPKLSPPPLEIDMEFENEQDSTFELEDDEVQETPTRTRSQSFVLQLPTRTSSRRLPSRTGSLMSDARSSITSERRRTRGQDRPEENPLTTSMNGHLTDTTLKGQSSPRNTRQTSVSLHSPRKRSRVVSSPESSLLSEPPSSYARTSEAPSDDEETSEPRRLDPLRHPTSNGNGVRITRSRGNLGDNRSNKRAPSRRSSLRLNGNGTGDDHHFKPLFDDPEEALRNAKKARLNQAIAQTASIPGALLPMTNGVTGNGNTNGLVATAVHVHLDSTFDDSDLLDADAEGEVEDVIGLDLELSDEDVDAEGELDDLDAEGEVEEMELC